jgi:hypothetical protein
MWSGSLIQLFDSIYAGTSFRECQVGRLLIGVRPKLATWNLC